MNTKGSGEEGESDSKDRLPEQTSLDTAKSNPSSSSSSMSAAVAPADLKSQASAVPSSGGALVMNPLVPSSLPRRASLHTLTTSEPALKKRKIGESGSAASVSQHNSSSDSIHHQSGGNSRPASTASLSAACLSPQGGGGGGGEKVHNEDKVGKRSATNLQGDGDAVVVAKPPPPPEKANGQSTAATATTTTAISAAATTTASSASASETTADAAAITAKAETSATSKTPSTTAPAAAAAGTKSSSAATAPATTTAATTSQASAAPSKPPEKPPLKSTKMSHLRQKYTGELEYMLREFEKLERQLLGARKTEESAASRERREKLHSFILHLSETIQQIEKGCELEAAGQSTLPATKQSTTAQDAALANPSQDKEEEENVQKLEEHILANLLPVKVRLKKQLAAQQGAKHNPATMPHRGGHGLAAAKPAGSTFADSARRQQEAKAAAAAAAQQETAPTTTPAAPVAPDQTQFGKPLVKGSFLTKKLHGPTLGSSQRAHGDGVGASETTAEKKKYYGGLAVGSVQMESSIDAASNVHKVVIEEPALVVQSQGVKEEPKVSEPAEKEKPVRKWSTATTQESPKPAAVVQFPSGGAPPAMSDERRRKLRRKKRKKKRLREKAKAAAAEKRELEKGRKQKAAKKSHRGPRHVEYMCALCNEVYNSTCDYNPWWALAQHDCPKCRKRQIPRIDIGAPSNAIEYHPALLAHADDNGGVAPAERSMAADVTEVTPSAAPSNVDISDDDSLGNSDISSDYADISTDDDADSLDSESDELEALSPADRAEQERFGADYGGPTLEEREASRLLVLMSHASTCPCQHKSREHREVCRSVKWMMLHVRDCPGTTSNYDVCPFPWCRKMKHLLFHLVSCQEPESCKICAPADHGRNLLHLQAMNDHRMQFYRQKLLAKFAPPPAPKAAPARAKAPKDSPRTGDRVASEKDIRPTTESKAQPVASHPGASIRSPLVDVSGSKESKAQPVIKQEPEAQEAIDAPAKSGVSGCPIKEEAVDSAHVTPAVSSTGGITECEFKKPAAPSKEGTRDSAKDGPAVPDKEVRTKEESTTPAEGGLAVPSNVGNTTDSARQEPSVPSKEASTDSTPPEATSVTRKEASTDPTQKGPAVSAEEKCLEPKAQVPCVPVTEESVGPTPQGPSVANTEGSNGSVQNKEESSDPVLKEDPAPSTEETTNSAAQVASAKESSKSPAEKTDNLSLATGTVRDPAGGEENSGRDCLHDAENKKAQASEAVCPPDSDKAAEPSKAATTEDVSTSEYGTLAVSKTGENTSEPVQVK